MSFVAIIGSGALGGAVAHAIARRDRIGEVRLIDAEGSIARGKALDILQSSPIDGFSTRTTAADTLDAASGAAAVVIADSATDSAELEGEGGLAMLRRVVAIEPRAPFVCAGASQRELIRRAVAERYIGRDRILGSAPLALESALRALAAIPSDGSGAEVHLRVLGAPPAAAVVAWDAASDNGQPIAAHVPPHVIAGLDARIPSLWPPGPYALGAACARIAEALVHGSRRSFTSYVVLDEGALRGVPVAMPVRLREGGIARVLEPILTRQERTRLENAIELP